MDRLNHRYAKRAVEALRKPILGPIIFGLVLIGLPVGFGFRGLGGSVASPNLPGTAAHLTPAAIILVAVQGIAFGGLSWRRLLRSSFLTSFAACVPVPFAVCTILDWPFDHWDVFNPGLLSLLLVVFSFWAIFAGASSFVLVSIFNFFKRKWANR